MKNGEETMAAEEPKSDLTKKQKKIDRVKKVILEGAAKLFLNRPYEDITMGDIADEIALSRATIYNYFGKKEDIYLGIFAKELDEICAKYLSRSANPKSEDDKNLLMAKILLKKIQKQPLIYRIYIYFLARIRELNISGGELITAHGFNIDYVKSQIPSQSDYKSLIKLMKSYNSYVKLSISDTIKDSNPKLVQSPSKLMHLYYILSILINGYGFTSSFPVQALTEVKSSNEKIVQLLLELIEKIAKGDISINF